MLLLSLASRVHPASPLTAGGSHSLPAPPSFLIPHPRGVGPKTASLIVAGLGPDAALEVLNSDGAAAALAGVKGIGPKMAARIKDEWDRNEGEDPAAR